MPYKNTYPLLEEYGEKFLDGTLTKEDIAALNKINSELFIPFDDKNRTDMMRDFVQTIAPFMDRYILHETVEQFLENGFDTREGDNTFMRNTTLDKNLLAFELVHYPESGAEHFKQPPISDDFSEEGIENLKAVILNPAQEHFQRVKEAGFNKENRMEERQVVEDDESAPLDFAEVQVMKRPQPTLDDLKNAIDNINIKVIQIKAMAVYKELERLQQKTEIEPGILDLAIAKTTELLTNPNDSQMHKKYSEFATDMQTKYRWSVLSALGSLMKGLGNTVQLTFIKITGYAKDSTEKLSQDKEENWQAIRRDKLGDLVKKLSKEYDDDDQDEVFKKPSP